MRALFLSLLLAASVHAQDAATYRVTFDASWSAQTHPMDFPGDPHFSPVVGAVHGEGASLWEPGGLASNGIEDMAETGRTSMLVDEVNAFVSAGSAREAITGGWIPTSPGSVMLDVEVTADHPLVTLVSMLAPSPDWFVGTESLDLREGDGWMQSVTVPLYVWDAGTDSGTSYTSPNANTEPAEPITRIEMAPFVVGGTLTPVGTMTFERLAPAAGEEDPESGIALDIAPNPVRSVARVSASGVAPGGRLVLFDGLGRLVREAVLTGAEAEVDVSGLAPGVYVLRLTSREVTVTRRLVMAR